MDQSAKLQSQYAAVYGRALNNLLLPRVLVFLQKQMRNGRDDDFDFKISALKVYLGLGGQAALDRDFTRKWMHAEWAVLYAGDSNATNRAIWTSISPPCSPSPTSPSHSMQP